MGRAGDEDGFVYEVSGGGDWTPLPNPDYRSLFSALLAVGSDLFYLGGDTSGEPYPGFESRQRRVLRLVQGQEASDMWWEVYPQVKLLDSKKIIW